MRYAIVSDIHANRQAWESVLADIDEQGADVLVCLGDVIGYGPMPQAVLDGVRERADAIVLGNHDAAVCGRMDASIFNDHARSVIDWTREKLDDDALQYLSGLPLSVEGDDLLFVHAEIIEPGRFDYIIETDKAAANLAACSQSIAFYGHTHYPCAFAVHNGNAVELVDADFQCESTFRYLINAGSAGEPRNPDDLRARYALFDSETRLVSFRRIEFDIDAYRVDLERERLKIRPYFIRVADRASGRRTEPVIPDAQAMRRLPVVPASGPADGPRRLTVIAPGRRKPGAKSARSAPARRTVSLAAATPQRKPIASKTWTAIALAVAAALVPLGWLIFQRARDVSFLPPLRTPPSVPTVPDYAAVATAPSKPAAPVRLHPLNDRLLSYWPADDKDESINGSLRLGPVIYGKAGRVRGRFGNAFAFNQRSGLSFGDPENYAIENGGSLTICFWYLSTNPGPPIKFLLGTGSPGQDTPPIGWSIYASKEKVGVLLGNGKDHIRIEHTIPAKAATQWQHVAVVIDAGDGEARLYHNGLRVAKMDIAVLGRDIPSARPLTLGLDNPRDRRFNYSGKIDDLAIWNRSLGLVEIGAIHERGSVSHESLGKLLSE